MQLLCSGTIHALDIFSFCVVVCKMELGINQIVVFTDVELGLNQVTNFYHLPSNSIIILQVLTKETITVTVSGF